MAAVDDLAQRILDSLPEDGSRRGNLMLRRELGCEEEDYWQARALLLEQGTVGKGRGKGGSIARLPVEQSAQRHEDVDVEEEARSRAHESALYEPMREVIGGRWSWERWSGLWGEPAERLQAVVVTGYQGRRRTGGVWSRPDIVCIRGDIFPHVPGRHLEVVTFEVKPDGILDVRAIYEALAHRRVATHAYAVFHIPPGGRSHGWRETTLLEDVVGVARAHGVGVLTVEDPADFETWEELAGAQRTDPDPRALPTPRR